MPAPQSAQSGGGNDGAAQEEGPEGNEDSDSSMISVSSTLTTEGAPRPQDTAAASRRMTTSEELAVLGDWDEWRFFLHFLETEKHSLISWQHILRHHCNTAWACDGHWDAHDGLHSAGLAAPKMGATGGWRVSVRFPYMFRPGDNLETEYDSPQDYTLSVDCVQAACKDLVALFLLSGSRMVQLPEDALVRGVYGVAYVRERANLLQSVYGVHHALTGMKAADGQQLWPTYRYVHQCQGGAAVPLPAPAGAPRHMPVRDHTPASLYQQLRLWETQEDRDVIVINMLEQSLSPGEWHDTRRLPRKVWARLAELVAPGKLVEFFQRHQHVFDMEIKFRTLPARRPPILDALRAAHGGRGDGAGEKRPAAPAHGSDQERGGSNGDGEANDPARPRVSVGPREWPPLAQGRSLQQARRSVYADTVDYQAHAFYSTSAERQPQPQQQQQGSSSSSSAAAQAAPAAAAAAAAAAPPAAAAAQQQQAAAQPPPLAPAAAAAAQPPQAAAQPAAAAAAQSSKANDPARPRVSVAEQPLGTWFAKRWRPHNATYYGTSWAIQPENQSLDMVWQGVGKWDRVYWKDLCCLLPLPLDRELQVGEELCAWWGGWCHRVTYVSPEVTGTLTGRRHGRMIVKSEDDETFPMKVENLWALQEEDGAEASRLHRMLVTEYWYEQGSHTDA